MWKSRPSGSKVALCSVRQLSPPPHRRPSFSSLYARSTVLFSKPVNGIGSAEQTSEGPKAGQRSETREDPAGGGRRGNEPASSALFAERGQVSW